MEEFWLDNLSVLYTHYLKFVPNSDNNEIENLNSIVRFGIYSSILLAIYNRNAKYLFLFIIPFILTYILYLYLDLESSIENFNNTLNAQVDTDKYTLPTLNNPMMNVMVNEYTKSKDDIDYETDRKEAYPVNDNSEEAYYVKKDMENKLNFNVFKDISDIYNNKHSQRNFYTMPNTTVPNDLNKFLDFVYDKEKRPICKNNRYYCNIYNSMHGRNVQPVYNDRVDDYIDNLR